MHRNICPLCGSINTKEIARVDEKFKLAKCRNCGFVFAIPRPSMEELNEYYNTDYKYNYEPEPLSKEKVASSVKQLHHLIKLYNPNTRDILDIGCSYGHTIYGLKQYGYNVEGTELSISACEFASKYYGLKIYNSEFPPDELQENYDVILMSQLIEHVLDPLLFLKKAKSYLKDGGIVFIGTPNTNCILFDIFGKHL